MRAFASVLSRVARITSAGLFSAALLTTALAAAPAAAEEPTPRLAFSVTGEAASAPDIAIISLGVEAEAKSAADAMADQAKRMNSVFDTLGKLGVAADDIETTGLHLSPVYAQRQSSGYEGGQTVVGYRALNMVSITLRDLDQVGPTLDGLVASGADRIEGVRFAVADPKALEKAARVAAVAELRERRKFYAEEAGFAVGALISLTEGGGGGGPEGPLMRMTQSATPIAPGDVSASVTLHAVYLLGQ